MQFLNWEKQRNPNLRIKLAEAVSKCCPPELGIAIAVGQLDSERRPDVVAAWSDTADQLRGLPDRGIFHLVERVCGIQMDRKELLGIKSLADVFTHPELTTQGLSSELRRAERIMQDPDALTEQLDSTAELLIDELIWDSGDDPEKLTPYANKIGFSKKICPPGDETCPTTSHAA